ncbi:glucosamine--fructose-6-phosphate aminotransferase (isomerizing) [Micromonospora mirobrigensis]|uniref:Glucosamine--fructose-6-phosphate aminotransferase (Isomerizing) n=2 Tax=Micromonospora mirobrigensis TaxID=262898 RepID=A0A1C4WSB2_9ACTN|nr:glucosamine--fructose-6-phosphate aminotransferase (isomerizing) [Micromonospora mirobrigensis]
MAEAGQGMATDIGEQPTTYQRILDNAAAVREVAREVARRELRHVVLVARGTSDHAALYGSYLSQIRLGLPAGLASPSVVSLYGAHPDMSQALVIGVSQSGRSPDLVEVLDSARRSGATTLALTNAPDSELARVAELHVDILAGPERAVAATKTYTAELLSLLLVVEGIRTGTGAPEPDVAPELDRLPELAAQTLVGRDHEEVAARLRYANQLVVTGRGYAYATAREASLKIIETSYLSALAYSGADLLHGPVAMADREMPVLAIVGDGPGGAAMAEVIERLRTLHADVVTVGPARTAAEQAHIGVPAVDERYSPLLDIIPLQRLALTLALARGEDPDSPRGLSKVTHTR